MSETPALSPSIAHKLATESALQAWADHRLLGNCRELSDEQIATRERGKILHNLVLEGGDRVDVIDFDSWRTSDAKALRDQSRAAKRLPCLAPAHEVLVACAEQILLSAERCGFAFEAGKAEVRLEWEEASERGPVSCHGVVDWIADDHRLLYDLKTTTGSVHPDACAAALLRSPGVIQDTAYTIATGALHPELAGRVEIVFLFAQSVPPFELTPIRCGGSMKQIGEGRWLRAIELFARYLAAGREREHWPPYADQAVLVEAPAWALAREALEEV